MGNTKDKLKRGYLVFAYGIWIDEHKGIVGESSTCIFLLCMLLSIQEMALLNLLNFNCGFLGNAFGRE